MIKRDAPPPELGEMLRKAELFSTLLDGDLAYVATRVAPLELKAGEELYHAGARANKFYILKSGIIAIHRNNEFNPEEEMEIARYVAGDVIGDFDFVLSSELTDRAVAIEPSSLLYFPAQVDGLEGIEAENPSVGARILLEAAAMISARLRSTQSLISNNAPWVRELRRSIYTDSATGLLSHAFLEEEVPKALEEPTTIVFVKPDRFKELNDRHGHAAGDAAMTILSRALIGQTERLGRGWALRIRSNETALVVPRCGPDEAVALARQLSHVVSDIDLSGSIPDCDFRFTASEALAVWPDDGADWSQLIESVSALLVKAWSGGGNRIYRVKPQTSASSGAADSAGTDACRTAGAAGADSPCR